MTSPVLYAGNIGVSTLLCDLGPVPSCFWSPLSCKSHKKTVYRNFSASGGSWGSIFVKLLSNLTHLQG